MTLRIRHVVFLYRKKLRWFFRCTDHEEIIFISLYPSDIRYLKYGICLLIPPFKRKHIKGNW